MTHMCIHFMRQARWSHGGLRKQQNPVKAAALRNRSSAVRHDMRQWCSTTAHVYTARLALLRLYLPTRLPCLRAFYVDVTRSHVTTQVSDVLDGWFGHSTNPMHPKQERPPRPPSPRRPPGPGSNAPAPHGPSLFYMMFRHGPEVNPKPKTLYCMMFRHGP